MILFIRSDATTQIGTGHVMRCLALAQAWQEKGGQVVFLSHCESQSLQNRIIDEGFDLIPIKNPHPNPSDLEKTVQAFKHHAPCSLLPAPTPWLVLDGYHFTLDYQKAIRDAGIRLLVIDDMNHLAHYHADIILNQNINAEHVHYACEPDTRFRLLLGTKYALLRKEFWPWRGFKREISEVARKILVTLGGGDPDNVTLKVVEAIKRLNMPDLEVQVIVGPSNPHLDILKDSMLSAPCPVRFFQSTTNMPALMEWADITINAGGSTCWELAFMGVPFVTIILAENQENIATRLEKAGAARNTGWHHILTEKDLSNFIKELAYDSGVRSELSMKGKELVDGEGASRVVEEIIRKSK